MSVSLIVSETMGGAEYADSLEGGSTGIDWGLVTNGAYCPLINQSTNEGKKSTWFSHNAVTDPITNLKLFIQQYTGVYGGPNNPAADFNTIKNYGYISASSTPNNADGLYAGLVVEMDWDVSTASQFDPSRIGSLVFIFGDGVGSPQDGIDLSSAFPMKAEAMVWDNASTPTAPSAPIEGTIGKSGDSVLGDYAAPNWRVYLRSDATEGGFLQFDLVASYSYTS